MAPLVHALKTKSCLETIVCITAQHRQMLDQVLDLFKIQPEIDLNLMRDGQDLIDLTSRVLQNIRTVIKNEQPDWVFVHGDTTTAMAASVAAFYANVNVAHVEAGLRTHNLRSPFPEEFNRQIITKIARWHFCPTQQSKQNLIAEGVDGQQILVTGNTVIDALHFVTNQIEQDKNRRKAIELMLRELLKFDFTSERFVLITGHRRENFGKGIEDICNAIHLLSKMHKSVHFLYPVHLNPNVQEPVYRILNGLSNVHLFSPMDYEPFVYLLRCCYLVLTDSGGIQEEAPSFGKPVLLMRDTTERPEAVEAGTVCLVGSTVDSIIYSVNQLLSDTDMYKSMSKAHSPYGDGLACARIVDAITTDE